jgi:hypothetical protein
MQPQQKSHDPNCGSGSKRVKLDSNRNLTKDYYYRLAMEEYEKIKN